MLSSPPDRRSLRSDVSLAACLAAIAGAANAIALRSTGVFAANMTGNVSLTIDRAVARDWGPASLFAAMIAAFVFGALACASVGYLGEARRWKRIHRVRLMAEAMAMALLGALAVSIAQPEPRILCVGLGFLMGWQNALATTVSAARARSTHLSGIFTDIGIDLATLSMSNGSVASTRERLVISAATCLAFCVGAAVGVVAFLQMHAITLFGLAGSLGLLAIIDDPIHAIASPLKRRR